MARVGAFEQRLVDTRLAPSLAGTVAAGERLLRKQPYKSHRSHLAILKRILLRWPAPQDRKQQQKIGWLVASVFAGQPLDDAADLSTELLCEDLERPEAGRGTWTLAWLEHQPERLATYSQYDGFWERFLRFVKEGGLAENGETIAHEMALRTLPMLNTHCAWGGLNNLEEATLLYAMEPLAGYCNDHTIDLLSALVWRHQDIAPTLTRRVHQQALLARANGQKDEAEETRRQL